MHKNFILSMWNMKWIESRMKVVFLCLVASNSWTVDL